MESDGTATSQGLDEFRDIGHDEIVLALKVPDFFGVLLQPRDCVCLKVRVGCRVHLTSMNRCKVS